MKPTAKAFYFFLMAIIVILVTAKQTYANDEEALEDYYNVAMENLLANQQLHPNSNDKRSCLRRGSTCDHRPNDCCFNSSCRCNLWGTNCKCQRMGLFQKWGRRR